MDAGGKTLSMSSSGLRMIPVNEASSSPFALEEPEWIPDNQHHCRRCGRCYCSNCCSHSLLLQRMYFVDPVKQCYSCAILSKAEEEFYDNGLTILINGRQVNVEDKSWEGELPKQLGMYLCRLSPDHRTITFTPSKPLPRDALPPPTIHLNRVTDTAVMKDAKQFAGHGIKVYYKDDEDTSVSHCMQLNPVDERSVPWIEWVVKVCSRRVYITSHYRTNLYQQALQMTSESRSQSVHN